MAVHVLIIDADPSAAIVTSAMVQRIVPDAIMMAVATAEQGWSCMQQTVPDVVLIDPVAHGLRSTLLIQLCKEQLPATRIVVLASAPTPALRATVQLLGIDVYLEKPVTLATLTEKLESVLTSHEDRAPYPPTRPMCHT